MKKIFISFLIILTTGFSYGQDGFMFTNGKSKVQIDVQVVNNLVVIPVEINKVPMHFLLDTGVEETILFSLEDKKELELYNVEKIKLRGLGDQGAVEGLKSIGNTLKLKGLESKNEALIVVLDESFNFSSSLGIEVNGIIGYKLFKDKCVEIDYIKRQVVVYEDIRLVKKLIKFSAIPIEIEQNKPYITVGVGLKNNIKDAKMLLDSGSSDAFWIFRTPENQFKIPEKSFEDFLGRGLSGEIYGRRSIIKDVSIDKFKFKNLVVAFPDTLAIQKMNLVSDRSGSVGSEICSRFRIIYDYRNNLVYLKKNRRFNDIFQYNKSGLEIQHAGVRLIQEQLSNSRISNTKGGVTMNFGDDDLNVKYNFELKPNFEIVSIRKNSPSDNAGLQKGDLILSINGVLSHRYKLQQIANILKSEDGKTIKLEIDRHGKIINVTFKLKDML